MALSGAGFTLKAADAADSPFDITLSGILSGSGAISKTGGGTLAVFLGCHALARGYEARIYTYNLQVFDPTWFRPGGPPLAERLRVQKERKGWPKLHFATDAYLEFLRLGGDIRMKVLDRELMRLRDDLVPRYAALVYNGFWFSPEREALQRLVDDIASNVTGTARLELYKGAACITGRKSPRSLYRADITTFEADGGVYDQRDATGFIKLNALRLRVRAQREGRS